MKIPFFQGFLGAAELEQVAQVLQSGWLTTGKVSAEFEARFAEQCSASFALATNSCTAALHLALEALGIGPGDKVIVPTLTFTATAEVIRYLGADPVFVDVEPGSCLITARSIEEQYALHPDIKAVMAVHFGGQSVEMTGAQGVWQKCRDLGIYLVQDAAHAFPARDDYGPVGSLGDISCFSFYANKTITTGEGGMLVTSDEELARRVRLMRLHGIDRDVWDRFTSDSSAWEYDVIEPGYKYNMPDVNAAIGIVQLAKAEALRAARQAIAERYLDAFSAQDKIELPALRVKPEDHAWHLFSVVTRDKSSGYRNRFIQNLNARGIGTSVHYKPLHRMTYYRENYDLHERDFPNAENHWQGCVSLPIFPGMTDSQVETVCRTVDAVLADL